MNGDVLSEARPRPITQALPDRLAVFFRKRSTDDVRLRLTE
jgi:hypothetical protein